MNEVGGIRGGECHSGLQRPDFQWKTVCNHLVLPPALKIFFFFLNYVYICVSLCDVNVSAGTNRGQKRASDSLKLQNVVKTYKNLMGIELMSYGRAVCILTC